MKVFDRISVLHLMAGALQAMLAYGLYQSAELHVWPATHAAKFRQGSADAWPTRICGKWERRLDLANSSRLA